jgi:hypothetical protein
MFRTFLRYVSRGSRRPLSLALALCLLSAAVGLPHGASASTAARQQGAVGKDEVTTIYVGETKPIVLKGVKKPGAGRELTPEEVEYVSSAPSVLKVVGNIMTGVSASAEPVTLSVFEKVKSAQARRTRKPLLEYSIRVAERPRTKEIKTSADSVDLLPGKYVMLGAQPVDAAGTGVPDAQVEWKFKDRDAGSYVDLLPGTNNHVVVLAKNGATFEKAPTRLLLAVQHGGKEALIFVNLKSEEKGHGGAGDKGDETKPHKLNGYVLGAGGSGIDDVSVTLGGGEDGFERVVRTKDKGFFDFGDLKPLKGGKSYTVTPTKPGLNFNPPNIPLKSFDADQQVNFVATVVPAPDPVTKFIDAKLDVLDYRTASNLFGSVTNKEYYVAKLQFFNKLYDLKNGSFVGDSIVIYSDSIKVPVNYEVMYIGNRKEARADRRQWHPLEVELMAGPNVGQDLTAAWKEWSDKKQEANKEKLKNAVAQAKASEELGANPNQLGAGDSAPAEWSVDPNCMQIPDYRAPYTFDQMMSTVDRRDAREWRTRLVTLGQSAATLTSFVTSFVVPVGTNDTPVILEKFNSLLMPSFKEHFPSSKEQQRQNMTREIMKPVETVPFKQDIVRMVFLPKEAWKSKDYAIRISHICEQQPIKVETVVAKSGDQLPIHTLSGRVEFEQGSAPVEGAKVELSGVFTDPRTAFTTRDGQYTFPNLAPGPYTVVAHHPEGCNIRSKPAQIEVKSNTIATEILKIPNTQEVRGRVLKDAAQPLAKATVELQRDGQTVQTATTDAEGKYVFNCVLWGNYQLVVKTTEKLTFKPVALNDLRGDKSVEDIKPETTEEVELDE